MKTIKVTCENHEYLFALLARLIAEKGNPALAMNDAVAETLWAYGELDKMHDKIKEYLKEIQPTLAKIQDLRENGEVYWQNKEELYELHNKLKRFVEVFGEAPKP